MPYIPIRIAKTWFGKSIFFVDKCLNKILVGKQCICWNRTVICPFYIFFFSFWFNKKKKKKKLKWIEVKGEFDIETLW